MMNFIQMERCHPHRPPPNFPPPLPPYADCCEPDSGLAGEEDLGILPEDVVVKNTDGRIAFDLGNGGRKRNSPKSSSDRSSDDSAYSESCSFRPSPPKSDDKSATDRRKGYGAVRAVSTSPADSLLNDSGRGLYLPPNCLTGGGATGTYVSNARGYVSLNTARLREEEGEGAEESFLSLPDLSYELSRTNAAKLSPNFDDPARQPTRKSSSAAGTMTESNNNGPYAVANAGNGPTYSRGVMI